MNAEQERKYWKLFIQFMKRNYLSDKNHRKPIMRASISINIHYHKLYKSIDTFDGSIKHMRKHGIDYDKLEEFLLSINT